MCLPGQMYLPRQVENCCGKQSMLALCQANQGATRHGPRVVLAAFSCLLVMHQSIPSHAVPVMSTRTSPPSGRALTGRGKAARPTCGQPTGHPQRAGTPLQPHDVLGVCWSKQQDGSLAAQLHPQQAVGQFWPLSEPQQAAGRFSGHSATPIARNMMHTDAPTASTMVFQPSHRYTHLRRPGGMR